MHLREVQVVALSGSYAFRREFGLTANVVEAVFEQGRPKLETGGTAKAVISAWDGLPPDLPRMAADPPSGKDGDNVDELNVYCSAAEFSALDGRRARRAFVLDVLYRGLCELADARGWDKAVFLEAHEYARSRGIEYAFTSRSKISPDRRLAACVGGRLDEDGAFVEVVVSTRAGHVVARSSEEKLKLPNPREIELRAHQIRWERIDRVVVEARPLRGSAVPPYPPLVFEFRAEHRTGNVRPGPTPPLA